MMVTVLMVTLLMVTILVVTVQVVTVLVVTVLVVMILVVKLLVITVLVVTVQFFTVLIVSNKWMQVPPVQCKMECSVSTLVVTSNLILIVLAIIVHFHLYTIYLGEFV